MKGWWKITKNLIFYKLINFQLPMRRIGYLSLKDNSEDTTNFFINLVTFFSFIHIIASVCDNITEGRGRMEEKSTMVKNPVLKLIDTGYKVVEINMSDATENLYAVCTPIKMK
ncbi:hypothetical protein D8M04_08230 [Oceanobacillus piezotolerans]|uniref:Uncharacterized protein n=1 Tax=Oceanobacillus piezotolerans TaxID=2448030 RepID=A0A498DA10_9BACI|nr:hypothetical protein [Oceanobacillus piezotolerans]RLL44860.1 hypothetical protein D8M04_08230 [Oceanobacillus piezotolerans]